MNAVVFFINHLGTALLFLSRILLCFLLQYCRAYNADIILERRSNWSCHSSVVTILQLHIWITIEQYAIGYLWFIHLDC